MVFSSIKQGDDYLFLLGGRWRKSSSGKTVELFSPSSGKLVGRTQQVTREEIDDAFQLAERAGKDWAKRTVFERAEILRKAAALLIQHKEELADLLVSEIAKPKKQAEDEVVRTAELIEYVAEDGKRLQGEMVFGDSMAGSGRNKLSLVERVPLGTVLAISPFNYPINLAASKIAPALIAGNSVIFKPATQGAISGLHLAEIFVMAGVPEGVLSAITGRGSEVGDYLVSHPKTAAVAFTGGTKTGVKLAQLAKMVPLQLELGGKDAAIVLPDADVDETAKNIVAGAFSYSGQRCTAVKRVILVESPNSERIVSKVVELVGKLKVGLPEDNSDITNLIDSGAADYVWELIEEAKAKGASLLVGGKRDGSLIHPTVFDKVPLDSRLAWEEPFGPVLPIIRVKDEAEAVKIANQSEYGLQSSVFTKDIDAAFRIARQLEVGTVQINGKPARGPDHFPFVGAKSSGIGAQGIRNSIEGLTRMKSIVLNLR
jgi:glyceraldehyde-3-phosphate dehydrogenase (NADP+)